jgi:Tol biopolymer transport system component
MRSRQFLWIAAIPLLFVGSGQNARGQTTASAPSEKIKTLVYDVQDVVGVELSFYGAVHGANTTSSDVYIQDDPKKEPRRLVQGAQDPAWSYDGQKLAFLGFRRLTIEQSVTLQQTPPSDISCYEPGHTCTYDLSKTSRSISASSLAARQIKVMSANGSVKQITNVLGGVWDFAWSPVEEKIAYCEAGSEDRNAIVTLNADGSGRTELTKMGEVRCAVGMPVLKHAIEALEGIDFARVLAGKAIVRVISGHGSSAVSEAMGEIVGVPTMSWAPDGKTIAFTGVLGGKPVVGLVSANGPGNLKPLVNGYAARWSPDGKELLFLHDSETSPAITSLCIVNADGSHPRKVLDDDAEFGLTWSPDGKSIGFASTRDTKNQAEIFRIRTDGSGLQKIASQEKFSLIAPVFSPDGSALLFYARALGSASEFGIWIMDLASHQQERLASGSHPSVLWLK